MHYIHIAARVFNTPLLIQEGKLQTILAVLSPRMGFDLPAIAAAAGTGAVTVPDEEDDENNIAVLNVTGTLVNRMAMEPMSSFASYERIGMRIQAALDDPMIRGILLRFESYGGDVSGAFDAADRIKAAAQVKPIWASVDDNAFSAAYLLASQTQRIYVTRTAGVGSVGVIAMHFDWSQNLKQEGILPTAIYAGAKKNQFSPYQPLAENAAAWLQTEVDADYQRFVEYVASGRRMTIDQVRGTEAGIYTGQAGIEAGFADRLGTFQEARNDFRKAVSPTGGLTTGGSTAMKGGPMDTSIKPAEYTADSVAAERATARAEGKAEGIKEGAIAANTRIAAILDLPEAKGREQQARAIALTTDLEPEAAKSVLAAAPVQTTNPLAAAMNGVPNPSVGSGSGDGADETSLIAGVLAFTKGGKK